MKDNEKAMKRQCSKIEILNINLLQQQVQQNGVCLQLLRVTGDLDQMISGGHFQRQTFCDSIAMTFNKLWFTHCRRIYQIR